MKTLLVLDEHNYEGHKRVFEKFAVRGVIRKNGKIAMQHAANGEYKILGGGVEQGESYEQTLLREVKEEGGLFVKPETIQEVGEIIEVRKDRFNPEVKYICHSLFYYCDVKDETCEPCMTDTERAKGFELAWATPQEIIEANSKIINEPWVDRDTMFIEMMVRGEV